MPYIIASVQQTVHRCSFLHVSLSLPETSSRRRQRQVVGSMLQTDINASAYCMDDNPSTVTSTEDGIPLRSIVRRGGSNLASSTGSMNRKSSRNTLLAAGNSRIRKTPSRSKLKDSDEEASQSLLGSVRLTDGRATLLGEGEQDGEYDTLWKDQNDEEQSLLEEGRILVRAFSLEPIPSNWNCRTTDAHIALISGRQRASEIQQVIHCKQEQHQTFEFESCPTTNDTVWCTR
jgi:hypothetical protein